MPIDDVAEKDNIFEGLKPGEKYKLTPAEVLQLRIEHSRNTSKALDEIDYAIQMSLAEAKNSSIKYSS